MPARKKTNPWLSFCTKAMRSGMSMKQAAVAYKKRR